MTSLFVLNFYNVKNSKINATWQSYSLGNEAGAKVQ